MPTSTKSLTARVTKALNQSPHVSGHELRSSIREGHVVLKGSVDSFFQKQMAQEAIRRVDGVAAISNEIIVLDARHDRLRPLGEYSVSS